MSVPHCWVKYLAFNKPVPLDALPRELHGKRVYLASLVLPMGFLNSVSLAQHVHRNLVGYTQEKDMSEGMNAGDAEIRKDHPFSQRNPLWRVYLDNYDLLEKVTATDMVFLEGTLAPGALALRQEYETWQVPRNEKKSVLRSSRCEVQGATVDGVAGVAYPREGKLAKYFSLALQLLEEPRLTQKQWQVVCGGMVYITMFRRPLLGSLNNVWQHVEAFNRHGARVLPAPEHSKLEVYRLLGLLPLAFLDFRLPVHPQVTSSGSGGGICASVATTLLGDVVSRGSLRGELASTQGDHAWLVVGLFDGIGALRVAVEVIGVKVLGYVSVEKNPTARRVVEHHFPDVITLDDVQAVDHTWVKGLSVRFSQASGVLLGGGPPCQGVSGLNADRKGALKDARSCLFAEVPRIRDLFKKCFKWCPVYSLMESVASMDVQDRQVMSEGIGGLPLLCDAGELTWCHRPRLYWCDWEIVEGRGYSISPSDKAEMGELHLAGSQEISQVLKPGWLKVCPDLAFPTFTTSRPRDSPGRKPAGIKQCTTEDLNRWVSDRHRFPPYQYCGKHCVVNRQNERQSGRGLCRWEANSAGQLLKCTSRRLLASATVWAAWFGGSSVSAGLGWWAHTGKCTYSSGTPFSVASRCD